MEKIALISVYNYNYGSILQAFALQQFLLKNDINNEIVKYTKKNDIKQILRVFNYPLLKAKCKALYKEKYFLCNAERKKYFAQKINKFNIFLGTKMIFSDDFYGYESLEKKIQSYRGVILGSDQVWNPINMGTNYFTLMFVPKEMKKCTYASSFGVSMIPWYQKKRTKRYLERIQLISVRETSGKKIVEEISSKEAEIVVDPTLLFTMYEWNELIKCEKLVKGEYIFAYFIGKNRKNREIAEKLSILTGMRLILLPHIDEVVQIEKKYENKYSLNNGPEDFLNLIRNASYVCTDSFHATLFSIQYKKKFFVFDRFLNSDYASMNTRLDNVLNLLDLMKRKVSERENIELWYNEEIQYESVLKKIEIYRENSYSYIKRMKEVLGV